MSDQKQAECREAFYAWALNRPALASYSAREDARYVWDEAWQAREAAKAQPDKAEDLAHNRKYLLERLRNNHEDDWAVREAVAEILEATAPIATLPPTRDDSGLVEEMAEALKQAYEVMRDYTTSANDEDEWNNDDVIQCREQIHAALARFEAGKGAK